MHWILTNVFATYADILTSVRSIPAYADTSSPTERSPTDKENFIHIFGAQLEPRIFSAQNRLTSELLRTLSMMAASKQTSWLSMQLHLLNHLAVTWGP